MKHTLLLFSSLFCVKGTALAQATFSFGPVAALGVAGTNKLAESNVTTTYRTSGAVGIQGVVQFAHLSMQPSLRFAQKGLHYHYSYRTGTNDIDYRFNYLTLPLNVCYSLRTEGRGLQLFAGPYAGLLLGGNYQQNSANFSSGSFYHQSGAVEPSGAYAVPRVGSTSALIQQFDAGLQVGLGYRFGQLLAQADISFGLRELRPFLGSRYNNTAQASLSYLFIPSKK